MITSGFFDATTYDESTGHWDKEYTSNQFMELFSLFFKSGIFADYGSEFAVKAYNGLSVAVSSGFAFIEGAWLKNTEDYIITVSPNTSSNARIDGIFLQKDVVSGECKIISRQNDSVPQRTSVVFELLIAKISVLPGVSEITQSQIEDTRPTDNCGFVAGAVEQLSVSELYAQFGAQFAEWLTQKQIEFNTWFNSMKGQLSTDAAGNLQNEIDNLDGKVDTTARELERFVGTSLENFATFDEESGVLVFNL